MSLCVAVGATAPSSVVSTNPGAADPTWTPVTSPLPAGANAVACASANLCIASLTGSANRGKAVVTTNPAAATWGAPIDVNGLQHAARDALRERDVVPRG